MCYVVSVYAVNAYANHVTSSKYRCPVGVSLGTRLRELRTSRELTLAQTARAADISVSYLNDIEHDRTVPTLGRLQRLAEAFDLDARGLLQGVDPFGTRT